MDIPDFYSDRKYCTHCRQYVPYLMSTEHSFCAHCGNEVRLFSDADWEAFNASIKDRRPRGGRRRKKEDKESA